MIDSTPAHEMAEPVRARLGRCRCEVRRLRTRHRPRQSWQMARRHVPSPATLANGVPLVFAHRGGRALAPENTLVAFDAGIAAGADGLEFDVHLSRDGQVVIIHDAHARSDDGRERDCARNAPPPSLPRSTPAADSASTSSTPWSGASAACRRSTSVLARYPGRRADHRNERGGHARSARQSSTPSVAPARSHRVCLGSFSSAVLAAARRAAPDIPTSAGRDESLRALQRSWFWHVARRSGRTARSRCPSVSGRTARGLTPLSPRACTDPAVPCRSGRSTRRPICAAFSTGASTAS